MNKIDSSVVLTLKELIKGASHDELIEWYDVFTGILVLSTLIEDIEFEEGLSFIERHVIDGEFSDKNPSGGLYIFSHGTAKVDNMHYYWQGELFIDNANNQINLVNHHLKIVDPDFNFDKYIESMDWMNWMHESNFNPDESPVETIASPPEDKVENSSIAYVTVGCCFLITLLIVTLEYFCTVG